MSTVMASNPLPVIGSQASERADAARNRQKILDAARRLVEAHGIESVSMDMVAAEAGVGKGTIFRRFGDRATLALALVDEHEQAFQEAFIRGEPPLGPGAPPVERLRAVGHAMIDLLEEHSDLILVGESGCAGARFKSPPFRAHRAHVQALLAELDPRLDVEYHADSLLAVLAADQYRHLRHEREMSVERVREGWDSVVAAVEALANR
jgi:AcrR family transcriptional regulator